MALSSFLQGKDRQKQVDSSLGGNLLIEYHFAGKKQRGARYPAVVSAAAEPLYTRTQVYAIAR